MNEAVCTYCDKKITTDWYSVCDYCMENIVRPCQRNRNKKKEKSEWDIYKKEVWKLTEKNSSYIDGIETRGWKKNHIDHKYSIWQGFKDGKSIDEIASLENLRMLNYKLNMVKGRKCE